MRVMYERCCGLDVHKKAVTACVSTPERQETRTFDTMTKDLLRLADWLQSQGVTHVAMESTGVFWKPVYNLLEDAFTVLVVNARDIKAVPGRKTDVKDAEWIVDLLRHGLLRASYIPDRPQRELRELVRHRTTLVRERARVLNRIQKVLEGANVKLASVVSDVAGVSGQAILEAMVDGTEDPTALADMARGRLRNKQATLEEALNGLVGQHQRLLLGSHLRHLRFLDEEIGRLNEEVTERMRPFLDQLQRLDALPCVALRTAEVVIAELGADMSPFPSAAHLSSWVGLCPGNNESAGKRRSGRRRQGNKKEKLRLTVATVAADKGYGRGWFYERLARMGVRAYIPRRKYGNVHKGFRDISHFQYDPGEDVYTCPDGKKLRLKGFDLSGRQWHH